MLKIKASQITNLTDARYFAAKEVAWLSFNFVEGTEGYIEPMRARAIFEWVEGPRIVGEFDGLTAAEINFYAQGYELQHIQVGDSATVEDIFNLNASTIIKEIVVKTDMNLDILRGQMRPFAASVEAFELNFEKKAGSFNELKLSSWALTFEDLRIICEEFKIILSIDFKLVELDSLLSLNLYGLNMRGGEEEKVGIKSFDEVDEIFDRLEER